jgi:hypothetical protein
LELDQLGIDLDTLDTLFTPDAPRDSDPGFHLLHQLIHSPITPDTLEGIWRTGCSTGIRVSHPKNVQESISLSLFATMMIERRRFRPVVRFWKQKAAIYRDFINRPDMLKWESRWAAGIEQAFAKFGLADSLVLDEHKIIHSVIEAGLPSPTHYIKYKDPLVYHVTTTHLRNPPAQESIPKLRRILTKCGIGVTRHDDRQ